MRPGGGKAKGSGFENQVAKKLGVALNPLKFIRTQGSGARVGGKNFETMGQMFGQDALKLFVGDVVPVNEKEAGVTFRHSIETKFYKTPDNFPALVSGNANLFKWMTEAEEDAVKIGRNPLLIFKWNNTPIFTATSTQLMYPTQLMVSKDGRTIFISYFDDMLKFPAFWYDGTIESKKEILNESSSDDSRSA